MQRMMRRRQARRGRQLMGFTSADSVDGYRGRDCSIEELIEYIDAKPPSVPKPTQKQSRKNRKKKRGSNQRTKQDVGGSSGDHSGDGSDKTGGSEDSAFQTVTPGSMESAYNPKTLRVPPGADKADPELSGLPLRCDTFFKMLPSDGSSSNASDADNALDFHADGNFGSGVDCLGTYSERIAVPSTTPGLGCIRVNEDSAVTTRPELLASADVAVVKSAETVSGPNVDEFGTDVRYNSCPEPPASVVSSEPTAVDCGDYTDKFVCEDNAVTRRDEMMVVNRDNSTESLSRSGVSPEAVIYFGSDLHTLLRRHSAELTGTVVPRETAGHPRMRSVDTGQSTPSSCMSDARDSLDFDALSLADDISSDFDHCLFQSSHESDFTVVTQKKRKKPQRQNAGSTGCLRKTFYNRNHSNSLATHNQQASFRQETSVNPSYTVQSNVPITCSLASANTELQLLSASQFEVLNNAEIVQSLTHDQQMRTDTDTVSSALHVDHNFSDTLARSENTSVSASTSAHHTSRPSVMDMKWVSAECRTSEKVFLDTRKPNTGITPGSVSSELSFWYDVNIPDNQSIPEPSDSTVSSTLGLVMPTGRSEVLSTSTSANSADFPTTSAASGLSSLCTDARSVLYVDSCTHQLVSLQSSAGSTPFVLDSALALPRQSDRQPIITQVDNSVHGHRLLVLSDAGTPATVSFTSGISASNGDVVNSGDNCINLIATTASTAAVGRSSSAVVSDSGTVSARHSSKRSRQLFDLCDAQLFLYRG